MHRENQEVFSSSFTRCRTRFYSLHTGNKRVYTVVEISLFYPFYTSLKEEVG